MKHSIQIPGIGSPKSAMANPSDASLPPFLHRRLAYKPSGSYSAPSRVSLLTEEVKTEFKCYLCRPRFIQQFSRSKHFQLGLASTGITLTPHYISSAEHYITFINIITNNNNNNFSSFCIWAAQLQCQTNNFSQPNTVLSLSQPLFTRSLLGMVTSKSFQSL